MERLTQAIKEHARECGADLVGIASIERFEGVAPEHHPLSIMPEARSVVVIGRRITRGTLRGVEEGTQMSHYGMYGYDWLDNRFVALTTFRTAEFIEDHRWEAVPLAPLPAQIPASGIPVRAGLPAPNVMIDLEDAAVRAGLGEIGYCGLFLSPRYGPRQRFVSVFTAAEIPPDRPMEKQQCVRCMRCVRACPVQAIGDLEYPKASIDKAKCTGRSIELKKRHRSPCGICIKVCPVGRDRKLYGRKDLGLYDGPEKDPELFQVWEHVRSYGSR